MKGNFTSGVKKTLAAVMTGAMVVTTAFVPVLSTTTFAEDTVLCTVQLQDSLGKTLQVYNTINAALTAANPGDKLIVTGTVADSELTGVTVNKLVTIDLTGAQNPDKVTFTDGTIGNTPICHTGDTTTDVYKFAKHVWDTNTITYNWADDGSMVSCSISCSGSGETESWNLTGADIACTSVPTNISCSVGGTKFYSISKSETTSKDPAGAAHTSVNFADTYELTIAAGTHSYEKKDPTTKEVITDYDQLHNYGIVTLNFDKRGTEYVYDSNGNPVILSAAARCAKCGYAATKVTATVVGTGVVTKQPTLTTKGETTYTINVTADGTTFTVTKTIANIAEIGNTLPLGVEFATAYNSTTKVYTWAYTAFSHSANLEYDNYITPAYTNYYLNSDDCSVYARVKYYKLNENGNIVKDVNGNIVYTYSDIITIKPVKTATDVYATANSDTKHYHYYALAYSDTVIYDNTVGDNHLVYRINGYTYKGTEAYPILEKHVEDTAKGSKVATEATCTTAGTIKVTCKYCGQENSIVDNPNAPATGHALTSDVLYGTTKVTADITKANKQGLSETVPATYCECTDTLYTYKYCTNCKKYILDETATVKAKGHQYALIASVYWYPMTKDADGNLNISATAYYRCAKCNTPASITYRTDGDSKNNTATLKYDAIEVKLNKAADCTSYDTATFTITPDAEYYIGPAFSETLSHTETLTTCGSHNYTATYAWSADYHTATATLVCQNDATKDKNAAGRVITVKADVQAVDNADGSTTYTATATYAGKTYASESKTVIDLSRCKVVVNDGKIGYVGEEPEISVVNKNNGATVIDKAYTIATGWSTAMPNGSYNFVAMPDARFNVCPVVNQTAATSAKFEAKPSYTLKVKDGTRTVKTSATTATYKRDYLATKDITALLALTDTTVAKAATISYLISDESIDEFDEDDFELESATMIDAGKYYVYADIERTGYVCLYAPVAVITIDPEDVTVRLNYDNQYLKYGEVPAIAVNITAAVDDIADLGLDEDAVAEEITDYIVGLNVGTYDLVDRVETLLADNNLDLTIKPSPADGNITIVPREAVVRVGSFNVELGQAVDFEDAYTVTGIAEKDADVENPLNVEVVAKDSSIVSGEAINVAGDYEITATANNANYNVTVVPGVIAVGEFCAEDDHVAADPVVVTVPATCTEAGSKITTTICKVCGAVLDVKEETIPALGHKAVTNTVTEDATCTEDGSKTTVTTCSVCGDVLDIEVEVIPATGHTVVVDEAVAATATTTGLTEGSHCSVCGEVLVEQEVIPMLFNGWFKNPADGCWYYYVDDEAVTGWNYIMWNGVAKWYYFNEDGQMLKGWVKPGNAWYYLGADGAMITGWQYLEWNGVYNWYYFDLADGWMSADAWIQYKGSWYYVNGSGAMVKDGIYVIAGKSSSFDANGRWTGYVK